MKKLILILALLLFSCGARKSHVEITKEETKDKTETNIKKTETIKVDYQSHTTTIESVVEPIDNTKEAVLTNERGEKVIMSNSKKTTRTIVKNDNVKTEIKKDSAATVKNNIETKKENKIKTTEKEKFNIFSLWWLLIPIGLIWVFRKKIPYLKLLFVAILRFW